MLDRFLLNPWISRAGNLVFLISVALLVKRFVSGWKPETLLVVILLTAGVMLMALPHFAKRLRKQPMPTEPVASGVLTDTMKQLRAELRHLRDSEKNEAKTLAAAARL